MKIIKSFKLDKSQLKLALEEWLNACVLKERCEIEYFDISYTDEIEIELKEPVSMDKSNSPDDKSFVDSRPEAS
jgi:hypothetical protein